MGLFRRDNLITRLCRESGRWLLIGREGELYWVRADGCGRLQEIFIRYREHAASVAFQSRFPVRFPLDGPPSGLYARLLMRNFQRVFTSWAMDIGESCEAVLRVVARVPTVALDAPLFDEVCREMVDEIADFHQELRDKFRGVMDGHGGGPAVPDVRYIEPDMPGLPSADAAWRMIRDQGGPVRYRLPGREK